MKKAIFLSGLSLVCFAACSGPTEGHLGSLELTEGFGIVGGQTVSASDPIARRVHRMEMITQKGERRFRSYCSTSLVHPRLLLIAAHCLPEEGEKGSLKIVFTLPNKKTSEIEVIDWEIHPNEDLAVLEMATDAPSSAEILLLPDAHRSYDLKSVQVAGYGRITGQVGADGKERILRKASLGVSSYDPEDRWIELDQSLGKGLCDGDSGGPGWIKDGEEIILLGIAVEGLGADKNDNCNLKGRLVNLSIYLDWIFQTAREIQSRTSRPDNQLQK